MLNRKSKLWLPEYLSKKVMTLQYSQKCAIPQCHPGRFPIEEQGNREIFKPNSK